jgi:hypothetical protein
VQDILSVVETEELSDLVLVGHSYGGFVISGVADTLRARVAHYVYLDASVPPDMSPGTSFSWADFNPPEAREARLKSVREQGKGVALLSGGPIYISDRLGRTKPEILYPLCLPDGRILRCDGCALPDLDCLLDDPTTSGHAFKVVNLKDGAVYVAAFNLDSEKKAVSGRICPREIGCPDDTILYEYFSGLAKRLSKGESYDFTLNRPDDFRLYELVPLTGGTAVIGIAEKFISSGAVRITDHNTIETLCGGTLLVFSENPIISASGNNGAEYDICHDGNLNKIKCPAGILRVTY